MNEYSYLGWPIFPDISKHDSSTIRLRADMKGNNSSINLRAALSEENPMISIKVKMCDDKDRNFGISERISFYKGKELRDLQDMLKNTSIVSPAIQVVLNATINLANSQKNYDAKLAIARVEIRNLKMDTTITTTTIPTTTTQFIQPSICGKYCFKQILLFHNFK
jgi:hypothetical protein